MHATYAATVVCVALFVCLSHTGCAAPDATGLQLDLCSWGATHKDACLPGGKYDPLLKRCAGAMPGSQCYACFAGPNCQTLVSNESACTVVSGGGNPLVFQEYWEQQAFDGCTSVPTSYREGYQTMGNFAPISDVEDAIRMLHGVVGNANTTGHEVVLGFGSTQVMAATLFAKAALLAETDPSATLQVYAPAPYYMHYPYQANVTVVATPSGATRLGAVWAGDASAGDPSTFEIVTHPNNPNGEMRVAHVPDDQAVYDCAYLWPHFTSEYNQMLNYSTMIFTASKMAGQAGSRFGWALVRDKAQAALMRQFVSAQTLGMDISAQVRQVNVLRTLATQGVQDPNGMFAFAIAKLEARWKEVHAIFNSTTAQAAGFAMLSQCTSPNRCGAYVWLQCPPKYSCAAVFAAVSLVGESGLIFGSTDNFIRFELMMRSVEMELAFGRMRQAVELMANPATRLPLTPDLHAKTSLDAHRRTAMGKVAMSSPGC